MFSKKNKKSAFTLIEMLIVIVIIGILAAALIPRLSSARGRANDVARKADLSQIATALVSSQIDRGTLPKCTSWCALSNTNIHDDLLSAGMDSIPTDPNSSRAFSWLGITNSITAWQYGYITITKRSITDNGFVLMAATETEWWSNRVYLNGTWDITNDSTFDSIHLCKTFSPTGIAWNLGAWACTYDKTKDQLRYIYIY